MWQVRGYDTLLRQIETSVREGRYAHAYLLVGPPQVGKHTLAVNMAQAVNCLSSNHIPCGECTQCLHIARGHHADVRIIEVQREEEDGPSRKEIGIGDVREVQHQASLKPYEGKHRVFVFDGAEHMSEEAANALLKTPGGTSSPGTFNPCHFQRRGLASDYPLPLPATGTEAPACGAGGK